MKYFSLPTWIATRLVQPFLPVTHPFHNRPFTLDDWKNGQTDLCRWFDWAIWISLICIGCGFYAVLR
jgi:hypothetical protein